MINLGDSVYLKYLRAGPSYGINLSLLSKEGEKEMFTAINTVLVSVALILICVVLKKIYKYDYSSVVSKIEEIVKEQERIEQKLSLEFSINREEMGRLLKDQRIELAENLSKLRDNTISIQGSVETKFDNVRDTIDSNLKSLQLQNERHLTEMRKTIDITLINMLEKQRVEVASEFSRLRGEVIATLKQVSDTIFTTLKELSKSQQDQLFNFSSALKELTGAMENKLEVLRFTVDGKLAEIQENNMKQLEEIRKNVNERLSDALEKRLADSFRLVSERLEAVHKGLGEMQSLAAGVGDLKRVLSNVKARGAWAEIQLEAILEHILTPEQYAKNVQVKPNSQERVEFAIRLPGPKEDRSQVVWLPIDSKFPQEDYMRLQDAIEKGDPELLGRAQESLKKTALQCARKISEKYINPPHTTDFAVMFLATEGLYAEVLRQPGLAEELQTRYRVIPSGPTTLSALLSGLRMGFHTLAIEQRASEVWRLLGAVKTEFKKFGESLDKVKRYLDNASKTLEDTGTRTKVMERKLKAVEEIPEEEAETLLRIEA